MLEASQLACRRGDRLLFSGLSFQVEPSTLLHVEGHNGSGKTTLLRALCGLSSADEGEIRWRGTSIASDLEAYHAELLYFGHLNGIKSDLTGIENLRIAAGLAGDKVPEADLWDALSRMGLAGFEDLPTKVLSQGQKKRVALAKLLLTRAAVWILDEPFTALDVDAVDFLQSRIAHHVEGGGICILTTHQAVELTEGQVQRLRLGRKPRREA
ncbi:MAG: cytochrome c biogenesis heme-transporting ATPase CcmA [Gammaproteobacteria bacterium]